MLKLITRLTKILMVFTLSFSTLNLTPVLASQPTVHADDDLYVVGLDTTLNVSAPGVLGNDNDTLDASKLHLNASLDPNNGPINGSLSFNSDGSFSFTPTTGFTGVIEFDYIANGVSDTDAATVTLVVNPSYALHVSTDDTTNNAGGGLGGYEEHFENESVFNWYLNWNLYEGQNDDKVQEFVRTYSSIFSPDPEEESLVPGKVFLYYEVNEVRFHQGILNFVSIISIYRANVAPNAIDDAYITDEDTKLTIAASGVLSNDTDGDNDTLNSILADGPSHGTLQLNANGSFEYTPSANYFGPDSFTYYANDGFVDSTLPATVHITITSINDAPIAVDDEYMTNQNTDLVIDSSSVLDNDSDLETSISVSSYDTTSLNGGTIEMSSDGTFTYTPFADFYGEDSFTYSITDGEDEDTATVTITVNGIPTAVDDEYSTNEDTTLNISASGFLANDVDPDSDPLTASLVDDVTNGTLTFNNDGSFTYVSDADFNGSDSFTYRVTDGKAYSNTATVEITINAVNDNPDAVDDLYSTLQDTEKVVSAIDGVLANDIDVESDSLVVDTTSFPLTTTNGASVTMSSDGAFTYQPDLGFHGLDSFTYSISDGNGGTDTATVQVVVSAAPVADIESYSTDEDHALQVTAENGVLFGDTDADDDPLTAVLISSDTINGSLYLYADGSFDFIPAANFNGTYTFTYVANDGYLDSNEVVVEITVNPINDNPVAENDAYSTSENVLLVIDPESVLDNDYDDDEDELYVSSFDSLSAEGGTVVMEPDGTFTYTPPTDFNGTDGFEYTISDGIEFDTAAVSIYVNDQPIADPQELTTPEDTALAITLTGDDLDEDELTFITSAPSNGVLSGTGSSITYTPNLNYVGLDSFTFVTNDGTVDSEPATISITVTPVNDAPVAVANAYTLVGNTSLTIAAAGILANDTDVEGSTLTAVLNTNVVNGTLVLGADGAFVYTPTTGFVGTDTFTYHANDGELDSNVVTVTITVTAPPAPPVTPPTTPPTTPPVTVTVAPTPTPLAALNSAPVANNSNVSTNIESAISGQASASDADGDDLVFTLVTGVENGVLVFNPDGSFTYTPNAGFVGTDSFSFNVNDGELDSNTANVVICVNQGLIEVEEPEETPLAALPMDFSWLYWLLGLLPLLLAFIRPNIKYTVITKDGTEKTMRRRLAKPSDDQTVFIVELVDKNLEDITTIDVTIYKRLAKHLGNLTVNFVLRGRLVHSVVLPSDIDEEYKTIIEL